ncbi:hypothetical protein RQP46_002954 [Phenoliferia psychrophenolica]
MLFLHGNGSNGAVSELGSKTLWDGMGLLISLYNGGNHTGAQQVLAEEYLTILPLLPLGVREWDTSQVLEVLNAAAKTYELDASRILISGYSVGAFGAFDTAFASPTTFAALIPSASGSGFNDSQLSSLVDTTPPMSVYVMYAAGDEKQPASDIAATVTQLEALPGASKANITGEEFQGNHHLMTSTPFESPELWTWIENQTKGASAIFTGVANSSTASSTAISSSGGSKSATSASTTDTMSADSIPLIDLSSLVDGSFPTSAPSAAALAVIRDMDAAFRSWGAFISTTPLPSPGLTNELVGALSRFFALDAAEKHKLDLRHGGYAWRGHMPFEGEATHGKTDLKEGFYGGPEHEGHTLQACPTYGKNQFPDKAVPEMRRAVLEYTTEVTKLGCLLCDAMSVALGLDDQEYIRNNLLDKPDPVQLFRAFHYLGKDSKDSKDDDFGIGEHSDFGLLTILSAQGPGLEFLSPSGHWTAVPHIPGSFVINVGDILDRLTSGIYVSARHRVVLPVAPTTRLSIPFFFDAAWNAKMEPFPLPSPPSDKVTAAANERWKQTTFRKLEGVWGQYLGVKVQKVFPDLQLPEFDAVERSSTRHVLVVPKEQVAVAA